MNPTRCGAVAGRRGACRPEARAHRFPIDAARIVSLVVTGLLMAALGVARGRIGRESVYRTALQTMGIAGAAALAGVLIGRLVTA